MCPALQRGGGLGSCTPSSSPCSQQPTGLCRQVVRLTWWAVCRDSVYYTISVIVLIVVSHPSNPKVRLARTLRKHGTPAHLCLGTETREDSQHPVVGCASHSVWSQ